MYSTINVVCPYVLDRAWNITGHIEFLMKCALLFMHPRLTKVNVQIIDSF